MSLREVPKLRNDVAISSMENRIKQAVELFMFITSIG